jgi:hypothetical protein
MCDCDAPASRQGRSCPCIGGARFQTQGGPTKKFIAAQHINCQLTIEIEELNKNVLQTLIEKDIRIYFLFLSGLRHLIAIKELIIFSSFTLKKHPAQ